MNIIKYNPAEICRICLSESGELNSIFGNAENISNLLMLFIEINENDGLPAQICTACCFEATNAFFFKQKCEESDKLLRNSLQVNYSLIKQESLLQTTTTDEFHALFSEDCSNQIFKSDDLNNVNNDSTSTFDNNVAFVDKEECENSISTSTEPIIYNLPDQSIMNENISENIGEDCLTKKVRRRTKDSKFEEQKIKLQCNKCDETFEKKIDLKRHLVVDHLHNNGEQKFQCIECQKWYPTDAILHIHMKTHNTKVYDCDSCTKKFARLDILVEHQKRHSGERQYICTKCGKGFYNQMYLDKHMQTHENDHLEKPIHQCTICGKRMGHRNHLMVHMRVHQDRTGPLIQTNDKKKVILCSVCGRSCTSRSNLAVHMRRHTGQMTNFCTVCGKGYPRSTDLTIHMRQHTGEKPFGCQVCDRRFARSDKLAIHMRTHTGEKPYGCSVCGRAFAQSNDLASHKRRNACGISVSQPQLNNSITVNVVNPAQPSSIRIEQFIGNVEQNDGGVTNASILNGPAAVLTVTPSQQFARTNYLPNFTTTSFR